MHVKIESATSQPMTTTILQHIVHYTVFALIGCMLLVSNKPFLMFINDSFISFMILTLSSLYSLISYQREPKGKNWYSPGIGQLVQTCLALHRRASHGLSNLLKIVGSLRPKNILRTWFFIVYQLVRLKSNFHDTSTTVCTLLLQV